MKKMTTVLLLSSQILFLACSGKAKKSNQSAPVQKYPMSETDTLETKPLNGQVAPNLAPLPGTLIETLQKPEMLPPASKKTIDLLLAIAKTNDPVVAQRVLLNIKRLRLEGKDLEDIRPLSYLPQLKELSLKGNRITDVSSLRGLTKLEKLNVSDNFIQNLESVLTIPSLVQLDASDNSLQTLPSMAQNYTLKSLTLGTNPLHSLNGIENFAALQVLSLEAIPLTDLSLLGRLTNLRALDISVESQVRSNSAGKPAQRFKGSPAQDLNFLQALTKLQQLDVSGQTASSLPIHAMPASENFKDFDFSMKPVDPTQQGGNQQQGDPAGWDFFAN
jgi:Leucine-rich repeat (LRR) protein